MKLLARHDPHPRCSTPTPPRCRARPAGDDAATQAALRAFELRAAAARSACCPTSACATLTQPSRCSRRQRYALLPEAGVVARRAAATRRSTGAALVGAAGRARRTATSARCSAACARGAGRAEGRCCARCFTIIWASPALRTRQVMLEVQRCLKPTDRPRDEPAGRHRTRPHRGTHRAVGQRQQGRAAAQHAAPRHPERRRARRRIALEAGAHGITVHPRPDERHIRAHDVHELAALLKQLAAGRVQHRGQPVPQPDGASCARVRPHQCTFVPDSAGQVTSDHGWDLPADGERLRPLIAEARALGVRVSLFMDPLPGGDGARRATSAPTASSSTPSLCARPRHAARRPSVLAALRRRGAGRAGARAWASTPATT